MAGELLQCAVRAGDGGMCSGSGADGQARNVAEMGSVSAQGGGPRFPVGAYTVKTPSLSRAHGAEIRIAWRTSQD